MKIGIDVTVAPDSPNKPVSHQTVEVEVGADTVARFLAGEYPFKLQVFIEAAIPKMVRDTIREAAGS